MKRLILALIVSGSCFANEDKKADPHPETLYPSYEWSGFMTRAIKKSKECQTINAQIKQREKERKEIEFERCRERIYQMNPHMRF